MNFRHSMAMEFIVSESGRLDALIAAQDSSVSRSKIQQAIKEGLVTVNSKVAKKASLKVVEGDVISFTDNRQPTTDNFTEGPKASYSYYQHRRHSQWPTLWLYQGLCSHCYWIRNPDTKWCVCTGCIIIIV